MSKFEVNGFLIPNVVIDELLIDLTGAELKCYLYILRKTKGWNKDFDAISVSQLMKVTGLSNRKVIDACNRLVSLGLLDLKTGARGVKIFSVKSYQIHGDDLCRKFTSEESSHVKKVHSTSEESSPVTSEESSHTKDNIKNTIKNTNITLTSDNVRARKSDALVLLEQFGIPEQLAKDFITHKKSYKGGSVTFTGLERLQREADKAGLPLAEVLEIMIERSWRGFKASWDWKGEPRMATRKDTKQAISEKMSDLNDTSWVRPEYLFDQDLGEF